MINRILNNLTIILILHTVKVYNNNNNKINSNPIILKIAITENYKNLMIILVIINTIFKKIIIMSNFMITIINFKMISKIINLMIMIKIIMIKKINQTQMKILKLCDLKKVFI